MNISKIYVFSVIYYYKTTTIKPYFRFLPSNPFLFAANLQYDNIVVKKVKVFPLSFHSQVSSFSSDPHFPFLFSSHSHLQPSIDESVYHFNRLLCSSPNRIWKDFGVHCEDEALSHCYFPL